MALWSTAPPRSTSRCLPASRCPWERFVFGCLNVWVFGLWVCLGCGCVWVGAGVGIFFFFRVVGPCLGTKPPFRLPCQPRYCHYRCTWKQGVGAPVIGGTVNQHGLLHVRVTRVGSESALAQIVRLVEDAQNTKAPIQALADKISGVFVPVVVVIAVVTFAAWFVLTKTDVVPDSYGLWFGCGCALRLFFPLLICSMFDVPLNPPLTPSSLSLLLIRSRYAQVAYRRLE